MTARSLADEILEQFELFPEFAERIAREYPTTPLGRRMRDPNPCVKTFGFGPDGVKCKSCRHLYYHQRSKRYYKCRLRSFTFGPATDHRVRWNACSQFKRKVDEIAPEVLN